MTTCNVTNVTHPSDVTQNVANKNDLNFSTAVFDHGSLRCLLSKTATYLRTVHLTPQKTVPYRSYSSIYD